MGLSEESLMTHSNFVEEKWIKLFNYCSISSGLQTIFIGSHHSTKNQEETWLRHYKSSLSHNTSSSCTFYKSPWFTAHLSRQRFGASIVSSGILQMFQFLSPNCDFLLFEVSTFLFVHEHQIEIIFDAEFIMNRPHRWRQIIRLQKQTNRYIFPFDRSSVHNLKFRDNLQSEVQSKVILSGKCWNVENLKDFGKMLRFWTRCWGKWNANKIMQNYSKLQDTNY